MIINRNNYEEFFLLYTDGELSVSERQTVEWFVRQNPDLSGELDLLLQTKLEYEKDTVLPDKSFLYQSDEKNINENNYEEWFLLYTDNELTETQRKEVVTFVKQHPHLLKAFHLLNQTKLIPEDLLFPGKETLYKNKKKPVSYLRWAGWQIAAAVAGVAVISWWLYPFATTTNRMKTTVLRETPPSSANPVKKEVVTALRQKNTVLLPVLSDNRITGITNGTVQPVRPVIPAIDLKTVLTNNHQRENKKIVHRIKPAIPLILPVAVKAEKAAVSPLDLKNAEVVITMAYPGKSTDDRQTVINPSPRPAQNNLFKNTVYKELNTDEVDNTGDNIYIGNIRVNKNKLGGLLKKARLIFGRAKEEESNIAIANFAIIPNP